MLTCPFGTRTTIGGMNNLTRQNADRFNAIAAEWDEDPRRAAMAAAVAEAMLTALAPTGDESVFEFGCGTGLVTLALAPHVGHILAMDSARRMLDTLRHKRERLGVDNIETTVGDLPDHPPNGTFSLVASSMTLHHIGNTPSLLRTLFGLLQPGGRIALADLDREDGSFHGDTPGVAHHGFDRDELAGWIAAAGFTDVRFSTAHRMEKTAEDGTIHRFRIFLVCAQRPR